MKNVKGFDIQFDFSGFKKIADLPEDYLLATDSFYAFEPIPAEDADELMTYELTIPYKERSRFEDILQKIGFPVSALKKVVSRAAVF